MVRPPAYASVVPESSNGNPDSSLPRYSHVQSAAVPSAPPKSLETDQNLYGTLQKASSNKIMLYDPSSGAYFDPAQLQAVQTSPQQYSGPQQPMSGFYTLPYNGTNAHNLDFMRNAATMQYGGQNRHQNKSRSKNRSTEGKKKGSRKRKSRK